MSARDERETVQLLQRALKERWELTPQQRKRAADRMASLMERAKREATSVAAARTLVMMDSLDHTRDAWSWEALITDGRLKALEQQAQGQLPQGEAAPAEPEKPAGPQAE